jgi:NADPH:quinone reductase-like Zn-dependent oxidoreductase
MRAIIASNKDLGTAGLTLGEVDYPHASENDVIVEVHAAGFTRGELAWQGTWVDRAGRDRAPSVPGHEVAGVVAALGYGTTGLSVGQRVFGLTDWTRDGSLADYVAVEARNLAPLPASVGFVTAAAVPVSGLTAMQGLFDHGRLEAGQTVLIHGAAGGVGSMATQLAHRVGARVIGTGRAGDRETVGALGADAFLDLENERLEDVGPVDLLFDVFGGDVYARSVELVRRGGRAVTIVEAEPAQPAKGQAVFFVVESDRAQLVQLAHELQRGRLRALVGDVRPLDDAVAAFTSSRRAPGKTIIEVVPAAERREHVSSPGVNGSAPK